MVRDVFIEEIVKKKKEPLDWLKIVAIALCVGIGRRISLFRDVFPFLLGFRLDFPFILVIFLFPAVPLSLNIH